MESASLPSRAKGHFLQLRLEFGLIEAGLMKSKQFTQIIAFCAQEAGAGDLARKQAIKSSSDAPKRRCVTGRRSTAWRVARSSPACRFLPLCSRAPFGQSLQPSAAFQS
jgi:hypothetical protein